MEANKMTTLATTLQGAGGLGYNVPLEAICPRCGRPSELLSSEGGHDIYSCFGCAYTYEIDPLSRNNPEQPNNPSGSQVPEQQRTPLDRPSKA